MCRRPSLGRVILPETDEGEVPLNLCHGQRPWGRTSCQEVKGGQCDCREWAGRAEGTEKEEQRSSFFWEWGGAQG